MSAAKAPLLDPGQKPKLKEINKYVRPFASSEWYDIGLELEVGDEDGNFLDTIKDSCKDKEEMCFTEMMKSWVRSDRDDVTWRRLLACLKELQLKEAAESVNSKMMTPNTLPAAGEPPEFPEATQSSDANITPQQSTEEAPISVDSSLQQQAPNTPQESTQMQEPVPMIPLYITDGPDIPPPIEVAHEHLSITVPPVSISGPLENQFDAAPDDHQPCGYELTLPPGWKIREYQHELAEPGIRGENYIFAAPTGSGKTFVAAIIIQEHLKKVQGIGEVPRVVFMVNTKPLADQQTDKLREHIKGARVECIVGDSIGTVKDALTECEIVVCTTGKFHDELKRGWVSLQKEEDKATVTLLVMDECHHARKSSAQAQLMEEYLELKQNPTVKLPQVIGLTASPGAGENQDLEESKTIDHLVNLCALLDATSGIVVVRKNIEELDSVTTKPQLSHESIPRRDSNGEFIQLIEFEMKKLEGRLISSARIKCSFPKWSQQYETAVNVTKIPFELSTNPSFRDQISILKLLICYSQALNIYMDLRQADALKVLQDYNDLPDSDEKCTPSERIIKADHDGLKCKLEHLSPAPNPLLEKAREYILERYRDNPSSRSIFFVSTKRHAYAVCEWISTIDSTLKPEVITGHTRETSSGMTQADQELAMGKFRSGESNVLVATSVAEEGLDVPACNFVIRFQHITNEIAKVQTQGRARAADSEVITILCKDSTKTLKELQNSARLEIVNKVIENNWFPRGEILRKRLSEQQAMILQKRNNRRLFKSRDRSTSGGRIKLMCRKCKAVVCYGSDIFTADEEASHHVVPGDTIKDKLIPKPHHKPGRIAETISKTHKIYCKNCDADWGILCIWPAEGFEFPVLKCKSFAFQKDNGQPFSVAQWSKAPFKPLPLDVWIDAQQPEQVEED